MPTNTIVRKAASKTVLTTLAWAVWLKLGFTQNEFIQESGNVFDRPTCNQEIKNIIEICATHNVEFELVVIPDFLYGKVKVSDFPFLFEGLDYKLSPILKEDYVMSDGHFNDEGHRKYGAFLDQLIKAEL